MNNLRMENQMNLEQQQQQPENASQGAPNGPAQNEMPTGIRMN
jgi:hypothetical protein